MAPTPSRSTVWMKSRMILAMGILLILLVPSGAAMGIHTSPPSRPHLWDGYAVPAPERSPSAGIPVVGSCSPVPCVADTLVLWNDTVIPGNYAATASTPYPWGIACDPVQGKLFVTDTGRSYNTTVIADATNRVVATVPMPSSPSDVAYDGGKGEAFVSMSNSFVGVISETINTVTDNVSMGSPPAGVAYDPGQNKVYVAVGNTNSLDAIADSSDGVVNSTGVGTNPNPIAYDAAKGEIFVGNSFAQSVSVVNDTTNKVVATIPVGFGPEGMGYDPRTGEVFVANAGSDNVSVISDTSNTVVNSIPVGTQPDDVTVVSAKGEVFVTNFATNNLSVISDASDTVVATIPVGGGPTGGVYDSGLGLLYIVDHGQGTLSILQLSPPMQYPITFTEGGLPSGTNWSATLAGNYRGSTTNSITFNEPNGTYPFTVGAVNGYTSSPSSGSVTVNGASQTISITFTSTPPPTLTSVTVTPPTATITTSGTQSFTASPSCTGGSCPTGTTYTWSMNNTLGTLNATTGSAVTFTAKTTAGVVTLSVTASLNGNTATGTSTITITSTVPPALSAVTINPQTDTLQTGASANFTITPTCTGGSCPAGTTYAWTLNNSLGTLNASTGPMVKFIAGGTAGSVTLTAIGTLNGISKSNSASITISSTLSPSLASVSITPPTATIATGGTQSLTGSPSCTGGSCPAGTTYTWSVNNSLGTLNASTGSAVTFTAKTTAGMVTLSVTATLNGKTATGASTITITLTPPPTLSAVTLSPPTDTLQIGTSANFTAIPACTGGSCPSGTTYSWSVGNTLATVSPTPGASVKLTAGSSAGSVTLYVNATLNGVTKEGTATITISSTPVPSLASVTIAPTAPTVTTDGSQSFTATPTCNGGNCPAGTTYSWSLSQTTLGNLSGTTGSTTTFTAGSHTGTVTLTVAVTLNGKSANSSTTITVKSKAPTTGFLGLTGNGGYILIGVIVAVVVATVAALFLRKKPRPSEQVKIEEKETPEKPATEEAGKPADGGAKLKG